LSPKSWVSHQQRGDREALNGAVRDHCKV
jgi:hypothetical protein